MAERPDPVVATGGFRAVPDVTLATCPPLDVLGPRRPGWMGNAPGGVERNAAGLDLDAPAVHLLKSGVDLPTIAHWLGHASVNTTNRYVTVDLDLKRQALARAAPLGPSEVAKAAVSRAETVAGVPARVKLTMTVVLKRETAEHLTARAIEEGRRLEDAVREQLLVHQGDHIVVTASGVTGATRIVTAAAWA